jgi:hypothetical protein
MTRRCRRTEAGSYGAHVADLFFAEVVWLTADEEPRLGVRPAIRLMELDLPELLGIGWVRHRPKFLNDCLI